MHTYVNVFMMHALGNTMGCVTSGFDLLGAVL